MLRVASTRGVGREKWEMGMGIRVRVNEASIRPSFAPQGARDRRPAPARSLSLHESESLRIKLYRHHSGAG